MLTNIDKPDITFFGEDLPDKFHDRLANYDQDRVDLVIVIGTSLKVAPVSEVPSCLRNTIPQIYISRDVSIEAISESLTPTNLRPALSAH